MSPRSTLIALLMLSGCPKAPLPPMNVASAKSEKQQLADEAKPVIAEAKAVQRARDEALWSHWTSGATIDLSAVWKGHDSLLGRGPIEMLGRAQKLGVGDAQVRAFLVAEAVSRAIADADGTVANLEASLTFTADGKEQPLRELDRLLMQERSAAKRQQLWVEALKPAARLDEAIARRDAAAEAALQTLGLTTDTWAAEVREIDLDLSAQWADRFLTASQARWAERLKRWADRDLKGAAATAADLPLLRRSPTGLDAAFPKAREGERVTTVLQGLGLYGVSGLTLDLSDQPKKLPLPLTVAPAPDDVRVSYRPAGGLRDQQAMLEETGRALATRFSSGSNLAVEPTGALFASLVSDPLWLADQGVAAAAITAQVDAALDARLLTLRRASGELITRIAVETLDADQSKAAYVQHVGRALAVTVTPADSVRRRLESAELFGEIDQLRAQATAEALRGALITEGGDRWWQSPDAGAQLKNYWKSGQLPAAIGARASSGEALLTALGATTAGGVGLDGGY